MGDFVRPGSIVRRIWGDADTILLVFAGSAAEFALNRAVDWLFFAGNLPRDPIARIFSTARFAQDIAFLDEAMARRMFEQIRAIHASVERQRGLHIPAWAHRDVLYMLIDYSERAYQLLYRPLTPPERRDLYDVLRRVGAGLHIPDLPATYASWQVDRRRHLERDLVYTDYTTALYAQYRRHLGPWRYELLLRIQALLVPDRVRQLLRAKPDLWLRHTIPTYRTLVGAGLRPLIRRLVVPPRYLTAVQCLDRPMALRAVQ